MATVSQFLIEQLRERGVNRIFGCQGPGGRAFEDAIRALAAQDDGLVYVRPAQEEIAPLMAIAHAQYTGEVGLCVTSSAPDVFYLVDTLRDARIENAPVVAIVGEHGADAIGSDTGREITLEQALAEVSTFAKRIASPAEASSVIDGAFRAAISRRGPAVVIVPHEVQSMEMTMQSARPQV